MNNLYIICIDDQPEVLNALEQDLSLFEEKMNVEICDTGAEAIDLMDEIDGAGDFVALIISDQVMPQMTGVDLLAKVTNDGRFDDTQKILLTGLATHEATIEAINSGHIHQYIGKPWKRDHLENIVKQSLTKFVVAKGIEYQPFLELLDQETLYKVIRRAT